jgi:hypothetical protein
VEEEEDDAFTLELTVPTPSGATDIVEVQSDVSWNAFVDHLRDMMGKRKINVAYKFSTHAKNDPPMSLNTAAHLLRMIKSASPYLDGKSKSRSTKAFGITIVDLDPTETKGKRKGESNTKVGLLKMCYMC